MTKYILLLAALCASAFGMNRATGECIQGGKAIVGAPAVGQAPVTRGFVQSYKFCSVTVYYSGTVTKAPIYSNNSGTPLSNPFTADQYGLWFFYAAGRFDVQIAGGGPPALAAPYTFGDIHLEDQINVQDFGARCDGSTDDTTAIQAAANAASGAQLNFPSGVCIAAALTVPSASHWVGQGPGTISILRQKANAQVNGFPWIKNSNQSGGNTLIQFDQLTFDGNASSQTAVATGPPSALGSDSLQFLKVAALGFDRVRIVNSVRSAIFAYSVTGFSVTNSSFLSWGAGNFGAIELPAESGSSSGILISGSTFDGTSSNSSCIKLSGTSGSTLTQITISGNIILPGDGGSTDTLGIELYNPTGAADAGFMNFALTGNVIAGESSSARKIFGISLGGDGGRYGTISGNTLNQAGGVGIEVIASDVSVTGNNISNSGVSVWDGSTGSHSQVAFVSNVIENPVSDGVNTGSAILFIAQSGHTLLNGTILGNTVHQTNTVVGANQNHTIHLQCNGANGAITGTIVGQNNLLGPGSSSGINGITLEQDAPCPVTATQLGGNYISGFQNAIDFGGDTLTRTTQNYYGTNGARFGGTLDTTTSTTLESVGNANPLWLYYSDTFGSQWITMTDGTTNPNVVTWNQVNFGATNQGGYLSVNSKWAGSGNWTQTSANAYTGAMFLGLGASAFNVGFGNATNANGAQPASSNIFRADTVGVGIGNTGITNTYKITSVFGASATWNPGAIANGATATVSVGVSGCAAGDVAFAALSTATTQGLMISAYGNTNLVQVALSNTTGGSVTPGSGTLKVTCFKTNL